MQMLRMLGASVADPQPVEFLGIKGLELWPRVAWSPLFALTFDDLQARALLTCAHKLCGCTYTFAFCLLQGAFMVSDLPLTTCRQGRCSPVHSSIFMNG